ncbi:uncharacterized protein J3R85_009176 [Psidium guajava]|nr:uncharacterized protein J3R85_009176 [Psidium guajava]
MTSRNRNKNSSSRSPNTIRISPLTLCGIYFSFSYFSLCFHFI